MWLPRLGLVPARLIVYFMFTQIGRQRGDLRYLQEQAQRRPAQLHEPEPPDRSGCLLDHGVAPFRWLVERRLERVPDQPRSVSTTVPTRSKHILRLFAQLPSHTLPSYHPRAHYLGREGPPRAEHGL